MSIRYITAVHLAGGHRHKHIEEVEWRDPATGVTGRSATVDMVKWIEAEGNEARVQLPEYVKVGVVHAPVRHIRTFHDDTPTDNLLQLPSY